jgi:hypothetical protein
MAVDHHNQKLATPFEVAFCKQLKTQNTQNYFYLCVASQPKNKKYLLKSIVKGNPPSFWPTLE